MRLFLKIIKPQFVFLIAAIILFYFYNSVTPPFQVPDEFNHFNRIYQMSEGQLMPYKSSKRLGGEIPRSLREFAMQFENVSLNLKYTMQKDEIQRVCEWKYSDKEKKFIDFPNTSMYSLVSYAPQVLAMYYFKENQYPIGYFYYGGRALIVICWIVAFFIAISIIPFGKWILVALALLPMNIYIANSLSADTMTNITAILFVSYILHIAYTKERFTYKNLILLSVLICLLALAKVVYIGLSVLVLVIPITHFKNKKYYLGTLGIIVLVALITAKAWSDVVMSVYTPYPHYNPEFRNGICVSNCANYYLQKYLILNDLSYFPRVVYNSLFGHPFTYLNSYIGIFGNCDVFLTKKSISWSYYALLLIALFDKSEVKIKLKDKVIFVLAAFSSFVLLLLSQHLTWDCVGEGIVDFIQGRYLIPIFPLLFLVLVNSKINIPFLSSVVAIIFLVLIHTLSYTIINERFFKDTSYESSSFYCGAETLDSANHIITSNPKIKLSGHEGRTNQEKYSGAYSLMLSPKSPYGFGYSFKNIKKGDLLEVTAMQKGQSGQLVLSGFGDSCGSFYFPHSYVYTPDKNGWGKMHLVFTFNRNCDSTTATFFAWNPDSSQIFIDNLNFKLRKFKKNYLDTGFLRLK